MTVLTESFNKADSDTLGPDQTWVEDSGDIDIVSNKAAAIGGVSSVARVDSNLATDNQYVKAKFVLEDGKGTGVILRKAASATATFYRTMLVYNAGSGDFLRLSKAVANVFTTLGSDVVVVLAAATEYLLRCEAVGDQLTTSLDGTLAHINLTDTAIASNPQAGIFSSGGTLDDWEAGDLEAVQFVTSAAGGTNPTTSTTVTIPTVLLNDILILDATHNGTGDLAVTDDSGVGSWTNKENKVNGTAMSGQLWWKRITNAATESAKTLTIGSATNSVTAVLAVYRGCVTSGDPIEAMVSESNASANETQAEITVLTANAQVCLAVHQSPDVTTSAETCTTPGTLVHRVQHLSTGGTDCSTSHASNRKHATGATGAFTWAQTDSISVSRAYALKPAIAAIGGLSIPVVYHHRQHNI